MPYNGIVKRIRIITLVLSLLVLAACAPQASRTAVDSPEAAQTDTVARIAHHRMEIGLLQTGSYTTNVLVDLDLPRGVRWTVLEFGADSYLLRFTNDAVPGIVWLVEPSGVSIASVPVD